MNAEAQDQLLKAIWRQKRRQVEALLDSGVDVNRPGPEGRTPLMQAVETENPDIVKLLLDRGADVNRPGSNGATPLHIAVDISIDGTIQAGGHPGEEPTETIELLLQYGASLAIQDARGKTALNWALDYCSTKIADLLQAWEEKGVAQPSAPPNGGPAKPSGNSGATEGPPSVT